MAAGAIGFLASALSCVVLLALVRKADRAFPSTNPTDSTWWFGYFRDLVNVFSITAFSYSFHLLGFRGPVALLAGVPLWLSTYGMDYFTGRVLPLPARAVLAMLLTLPALLLHAQIQGGLNAAMVRLFAS
jgi:hypothetical protein